MISAVSAPADFRRLPRTIYETPSSSRGTGTKRNDSAVWPMLPSHVSDSTYFVTRKSKADTISAQLCEQAKTAGSMQ
jgi:hypothetical protein